MSSGLLAAKAKLESSPHKVVMMMLEKTQPESDLSMNKALSKLVDEAYKRMGANLYLALRLSPSATPQEIKKNYRTLSLLYHPDKSRAETSELFHCISRAYEVLSDETERSKYDRKTFGSRRSSTTSNKENAAPWQNRKGSSSSSSSSSSSNTASDRHGNGARSKVKPPAPYSLRCSHVDHESVTLFWKVRPSDTSVTFELQTRLVNEVGWPKSASGIRNPACRKKNLKPHTAYHFRVRALDEDGITSAWSVPVTVATTKEPATERKTPAGSSPASANEVPKHPFDAPKQPYYRARGGGEGSSRGSSYPSSASSSRTPPPPPTAAGCSEVPPKQSFPSRSVPPPPAPPRRETASAGEANAPPKPSTSVPPLKLHWNCTVCKRQNTMQLDSCRVCGTDRDYDKDRINNIREHPNIEAIRQRERERFESARSHRDAAEAAARAEFSARYGATGGATPKSEPAASSQREAETHSARSTARSSGPSTARSDGDNGSTFDDLEAARKYRKARKRAEREAAQQAIRERKKKVEKEREAAKAASAAAAAAAAAAATNPINKPYGATKARESGGDRSAAARTSGKPKPPSTGNGTVSTQASTSSTAWKATKRTISKKFSFGMKKAAELLKKAKGDSES